MIHGTGIVTGQDIIAANKELFSVRGKIPEYKYVIEDWTKTTKYDVSPSDLRQAADQNKNASKYVSELFLAIVADRDLIFGCSRMFETFLEMNGLKWNINVCREMTDAKHWIIESVKKKYGLDLNVAEFMHDAS